jgi:tryptophan 2,3-dioxygenase
MELLDLFYLLIVLAILVAVYRITRRLSVWRIERRIGSARGTGETERTDTLRKLAMLRDSGSLSEEDFDAAEERVRRK